MSKLREDVLKVLPSLLSILLGLFFGFLVMLVSNPGQAAEGFATILTGAFRDGLKGVGQTLYYAAPLMMTGLSVGFAFKTGLFNIGASGQFIMGAFAAVYVGVKWTWLPGPLHWTAALLAAMLFGGLCALIPGVLKAHLNINEVVSSIMVNYLAVFLVNKLVTDTIYDSMKNQSLPIAKTAQLPKAGLDRIFAGSGVNVGILIAIACAILIYFTMKKTTFGFGLRACGFNPDASRYAGISTKRNIVLSMVIAGMLAGLGGAILYLAGTGKNLVVADIIPAEGFTGISVALLGLSNPLGVIFSALFISYINLGGFNLQQLNFPVQMVEMIVAAIVYFSAFSLAINKAAVYLKNRRGKRKEKKK